MRTVIIPVSSLDDEKRRVASAPAEHLEPPRMTFASHDLMFRILTPWRMRIVRALMGRRPSDVRYIARRLGCSIGDVRDDLQVLAKTGVIQKVDDKFEFPYDQIVWDRSTNLAQPD